MLTPEINNNIALVKKYLDDPNNLYAVFKASSITSDLETPDIKFVGASTISYPVFPLEVSEMPTYNPKKGYEIIDSDLERREVTIRDDRGYQIRLDYEDLADSHITAIAHLNNKVRQMEVPTIDKYRLNQLVAKSGSKVVVGAIDSSNFFMKYDNAIKFFIDNEFPTEGTIMYMTTSVYTALKDSSQVKRIIDMKDQNIDRNVQYLDSVTKIVVAPATRIPANIEFILVHPRSVICGVKRDKSAVIPEAENFDGALVNRRVKHDLIVQEDRAKAVYVALTAAGE